MCLRPICTFIFFFGVGCGHVWHVLCMLSQWYDSVEKKKGKTMRWININWVPRTHSRDESVPVGSYNFFSVFILLKLGKRYFCFLSFFFSPPFVEGNANICLIYYRKRNDRKTPLLGRWIYIYKKTVSLKWFH